MLPTPDTSHVSYNRVYEPSEDSFLLLDTLSSASETAWLKSRLFASSQPSTPLVLEVGPGSGVVIAFLTAHAATIFGCDAQDGRVLALAVDANAFACAATCLTVKKALAQTMQSSIPSGLFLAALQGDLASAMRPHSVDVLVFNPPYVPTDTLPTPDISLPDTPFEQDSHFLALAYAGGRDGMETTSRLLDALPTLLEPRRGCAYVLLCARNRPEEVKARIRGWVGGGWRAETVGSSGRQAGWEKLSIVRIWREAW